MGDFKNGGREWHPEGIPEQVRVHDFLIKNLGKAIPYGVYDMLHNQGWVSVGIDHYMCDLPPTVSNCTFPRKPNDSVSRCN